jgi:hypothetical protein
LEPTFNELPWLRPAMPFISPLVGGANGVSSVTT